jgi:hypothetical protein
VKHLRNSPTNTRVRAEVWPTQPAIYILAVNRQKVGRGNHLTTKYMEYME